ncbi:tyrosine-type recombinase/integrase [Aminivibrio sp.]|uniref:tyrosine-type recombinase/integrase n=1 Tax=Aminivibrio sp. TaxID=1872489 RepID=UPI00345E0EE0
MVRCVPLMSRTVELLRGYLEERRLTGSEKADHPLFFNSRREPLTRAGVAYVVSKYAKEVEKEGKVSLPPKVTPHVFRHTKAVHLLQANVNLIYIRDFLGHASVTTSEIYARADNRMKREALERAYAPTCRRTNRTGRMTRSCSPGCGNSADRGRMLCEVDKGETMTESVSSASTSHNAGLRIIAFM